MDNYIVSARRYRPTTFESVVGQKALTTTLKNAITSNQLAHAYLFCGPRGVGKTTCARIFAKTINCQNRTSQAEACNVCESCVSFNEQRSYNIHELDAASNNSVNDIRTLIEQVRIPPQIGKYSVYIIDEVHMLSAQAFNAFLKTLEEPPAHAIFILATTEKHKILPTILSRCQIYDFSRISIADITEHLAYVIKQENVSAEMEALNVIAQKSDGGMRDALSMLDQIISYSGGHITYKNVIENLNILDYEYYFKLTNAILTNDAVTSIIILDEIIRKGFEVLHLVTGLSIHLRDLLMCKHQETIHLLEVGDSIKKNYIEQAKACQVDFLYKALEINNECELNYNYSKNKRLLVELNLIRLSQLTDTKKKVESNESDEIKIQPVFKQEEKKEEKAITNKVPKEEKKKDTKKPSEIIITKNKIKSFSISTTNKTEKTKEAVNYAEPTTESEMLIEEEQKEINKNITEEDLQKAWKEFIESSDKEIHIIKSLETCVPILKEETLFSFMVDNSLQEKFLIDLRGEILTYLRTNLKNEHLDYEIILDKKVQEKPLTQHDIFNDMMGRNVHFKELALKLSLEL